MRLIGYVRVDSPTLSGAYQELRIRAAAEKAGTLVSLIHETLPNETTLMPRRSLWRALEAVAQSRGSALVVAGLERISLDALELAHVQNVLEDLGSVVLNTETLPGHAPLERSIQVMRQTLRRGQTLEDRLQRAHRAARVPRNPRQGDAPYGYALGPEGRLVAAPAEQPALSFLVELRDQGLSWTQVTARLQSKYPQACRGTRWHETSVQRIYKAAKRRRGQ